MSFDRVLVRRIALRLFVAAALILAMLWMAGPPGNHAAALRAIPNVPGASLLVVGAVLAVALALEAGARIVVWANRGRRSISGTGVACFVLGLISGLCALTLWLAVFGLAAALPGLLLGGLGLRAERRRGEGHSLLNLAGLGLNAADVLLVASQVITATIWK